MFTRAPKSHGVQEFVSDALDGFEITEKMPLQVEHNDFAQPDFGDSVTSEEMDYATIPMALMSELEYGMTQHAKPEPKPAPLVEEKFFKFDVANSRPDDYSDSIVVEEDDETISAQLYNQFFKKA
jgi:hypothetical protein